MWFDQSELRGGDAWDASIRKQIKECALFVPIVSSNTDARPEAYSEMAEKFRPSHADYTYFAKYGFRNWQGGGRSSAREAR